MRLPYDATLLVIDVQQAFDTACAGRRNNLGAEIAIAALIAAWREIGLPIVHVRHDAPQPASPYRAASPGNSFKAEAQPQSGETILAKATSSAFVDTGLEAMLTGLGRTTLVVCGVPTHGAVEATVRHAGDLGFRIFVVADACAASETRDLAGRLWTADEVHALSLAHMSRDCAAIVDTPTALAAAAMSQARRR